nr:uncharacterized protein LOC117217748 [Megalopta genalis]
MKQTRRELQPLGKRFGKLDLDRVGFFHDPSPAPFDKYTGTTVKFREGIEKGRQLHPGPPTPLFEQKFTRIFYGEALNEPWRSQPKDRVIERHDLVELLSCDFFDFWRRWIRQAALTGNHSSFTHSPKTVQWNTCIL